MNKAQHTTKHMGRVTQQRTVVRQPYHVKAQGNETLRQSSRGCLSVLVLVWFLPLISGLAFFLARIAL